MKQKEYTTEEIIRISGQVGEDQRVEAVCREHEISKAISSAGTRSMATWT